MELLLKRNEKRRGKYELFAKLELKPEEEAHIRKTHPEKAFVWEPGFIEGMKEGRGSRLKGAGLAIILGIIAVAIFGNMLWFWPVALLSWIPLSKWVFNQTRKGISVADLITGRTIRCKGLDELYVIEQTIREKMQNYSKNLVGWQALGDQQRISLSPE